MLPDISSPGGFLLGVLSLVGVVALIHRALPLHRLSLQAVERHR